MHSQNIKQFFIIAIVLTAILGAHRVYSQSNNWYVDGSVAVSGDGLTPQTAFKTIVEALTVSISGDTIHIASGVYAGGIAVPEGVTLQGAGYTNTTINGNKSIDIVVELNAGSTLNGIEVRGGTSKPNASGIRVVGTNVAISSTRIIDNAHGIYVHCTFTPTGCDDVDGDIQITNNIIEANYLNAIYAQYNRSLLIRNNTIIDNNGGVKLTSAKGVIENNILVDNDYTQIICESGCTMRHNLIWRTAFYDGAAPGEGTIIKDPLFRNFAAHDYRLTAISPARRSGAPIGTDLGALPFVPIGQPPTDLTLTKQSDYTYLASWSSTGAVGYQVYLGTEIGVYTQRIDVLNATSYLLSNLMGNKAYYVGISSLYANDAESEVSASQNFFIPSAQPGIHEENSQALVKKGTWQSVNNSKASGGTYLVSGDQRSELEVTFQGDSIAIYRMVSPSGGSASIYLDDNPLNDDPISLDFSANEQRWQVPAVFDDLGEGVHVLRLVASENANIAIDSIAIPANIPPTNVQQRALEHINYYRTLAGIPLLKQNPAINMAAQSHAEFYVNNQKDPRLYGLGAHKEPSDLPGFTGENAYNRAAYFGFNGAVGEDIAPFDSPIVNIDTWMRMVYHRNLIMNYGLTDMGFGLVNDNRGNFGVLNIGTREYVYPPSRIIYTYPASSQSDVPLRFSGGELPEPLPGIEYPVGYPISLYIRHLESNVSVDSESRDLSSSDKSEEDQLSRNWSVSIAELRDSTNQLVPTYLLHQATDSLLSANIVFLIAQRPLQVNTTYFAHVAGTDSEGIAFDHYWSFTTTPKAGVEGIYTNAGSCSATISWRSSGEASSYIEYGRDITYGQRLTANDNGTFHWVELPNLSMYQVYHYRVVNQDAEGNTRTSSDNVFTLRSPRVFQVPVEAATIGQAINNAAPCDVVKVAPGVYGEEISLSKRITLIGSGPDQTFLKGDGSGNVLYVAGDSTITGFTIDGSDSDFWDSGIFISDNASPRIINNYITGNSMGISVYCFNGGCTNRPVIHNNVIGNNKERGISDGVGGAQIVNNTIINNKVGIYLNGPDTTVKNNIIVQNQESGLHNDANSVTLNFNNVWKNKKDYRNLSAGHGDISVDPRFINPSADYHLSSGSACIDAGDPDPSYADRDNSRNDMGAYGGKALASQLSMIVASSPSVLKAGDEITFYIQVTNNGIEPSNVQVTVAIPNQTTYVEGSASVAQGTIQVGTDLVFNLGESLLGVPINLSYTVKVSDTLMQPTVLSSPVTFTWSGGSSSLTATAIVNGQVLYLPLITR